VTAALGSAAAFAATTMIANWPPVFVNGAPLELTTGTIAYTTIVQANSTLGQDLFPGQAPAVCAFSNPGSITLGPILCTLSILDQLTFLMPMNLGCVRTDLDGNPIGQCSGNFATPFTDGDGAVVVLGYPTTPTVIQIAICRPSTSGLTQTVCTPDIPLSVILTNTSANASCLVATCDGAGMCGWYAREAGSPCIPLEDQAANPCVVWTCHKDGKCRGRMVQLPENVTCEVGIPCQASGRCAAGVCQPGPAVLGCVPCTVDGECQCTGEGTVVGWCNTALGICSQPALLPPEAIDLDDPAVWLPLQPEERDDSNWWDPRFIGGSCTTGRGHRFCQPSPRGPPTCLTGRGMCGLNGTCGPPVPLCRYVLQAFACPPAAFSPLNTTLNFTILAYSAITNVGNTVVVGNVGISPNNCAGITGFPPGILVNGIFHCADTFAAAAQVDLTAAYVSAAAQPPTQDLSGNDLGGLTLGPGVYLFTSSAQLTGTLTLDAGGLCNGVFIFQIGSTLTTASSSVVLAVNGAQAANIYWQVVSSATLGSSTNFTGTIMALSSISVGTGVTMDGRLLASTGAVTVAGALNIVPPSVSGTINCSTNCTFASSSSNNTNNSSSSGSNQTAPCMPCPLEPAFANWFAPVGEQCAASTECHSGSNCVPWSLGPSNFTNCTCGDGRGSGGATRCSSAGDAPQGQFCSQQTVLSGLQQQSRPDLCARSLQCDGSGACVVLTRLTCPTFPLTDATASAGLDFGTCVAPTTCNANTGVCPLGKLVEPLPYGTLCAVVCSDPPTFGTCDGAGNCRSSSQPCAEPNPCKTANCVARARLDQPNSSWTATDVGIGDVGVCVSQPIEDLITTGGSVGCSTADNPCVVGQLCNGGGTCAGGQNVTCAPPSACSVTAGCSALTGSCTFTQLPAGSFCNPASSAGGGVCTANTTCQSTGNCVGATVTCPVLPNVTSATIDSACKGFHATCEGILDLITGTLPDMPSMTGIVSVIIPSGNLVLLADTPNATEQLLLNITGAGNTTQYAGMLMDFSGQIVSRAAATSISGVCVYFVASTGSPCTSPDVCVMSAACTAAGFCLPTRLVSCPNGPGNNCLSPNGTCVPFVGCTYTVLQSGESCNDQNLCTQNDVCHSGGICSGTPVGCPAAPPQGCQIYPAGQTCATGCTLANVTDGTNCSCAPRPGGGPVICTGVCIDGFCTSRVFTCNPTCPINTTAGGTPRYQCVTPGVCICTPGLTSINCSTVSEQSTFTICPAGGTATAFGLSGLLFLLITILLVLVLCSCCLACCFELCASSTSKSAIRTG